MQSQELTYPKELFLSYLDGSISEKEEKELLNILQNDQELLKEFRQLSMVWNLEQFNSEMELVNPEAKFNQLLNSLNIKQRDMESKTKSVNKWIIGIAASFLLGALLSFAAAYYFYHPTSEQLVYHEVKSPPGAKSRITLPDGSKIWLNAGSSIRYSNEYGTDSRQVELLGEAYFEVEKDKDRPFIVETSDLDITAYGTAFNVKSYPEENTIETTLVEGSVGVVRRTLNQNAKEILLQPNQRVVYYRSEQQTVAIEDSQPKPSRVPTKSVPVERKKLRYMVSKGIDTKPFTSWTEGRLVIKSQNLSELAVLLERKYDVSIQFASESLKEFRFSGSLENETIEQVITAIGLAANIEYEINEREILIKEK